MAQDCWSVVAVCATSYSWTTGPHRGAMESPQTAAGTRDPATPISGCAGPGAVGSNSFRGPPEDAVVSSPSAMLVLMLLHQPAPAPRPQSAEACPSARLLLALTNYGH